MKAIILAAGRGSRIGNLTEENPKCLLEVGGKRLIDWQLEAISKSGIKEVGVVVGYMAEKIKIEKIKYFFNKDWNKTNMLGSLKCASEWLKQDDCFITYSDIIYPPETVSKLLNDNRADISISYNVDWHELWKKRFKNPLDDAEILKIDSNGFLTEIGGKTTEISQIEGQYMGLLKITPNGWSIIKNSIGNNEVFWERLDMTSLLGRLVKQGIKISTVPIKNNWYEIDTKHDIDLYSSIMLNC